VPRTYEETGLVRAHAKWVRTSARKVRIVLEHVRGLPVAAARNQLRFATRDAAQDISKVLESAIANAVNNHGLDESTLIVHEAFADEGVTMKRWQPRARGRASRIRKRTAHITILLRAEGATLPTPATKAAKPAKAAPVVKDEPAKPTRAPKPKAAPAPAAAEVVVETEAVAETTEAPKPKPAAKPRAAAKPKTPAKPKPAAKPKAAPAEAATETEAAAEPAPKPKRVRKPKAAETEATEAESNPEGEET
jgi:large subunit ribosomal protein L22